MSSPPIPSSASKTTSSALTPTNPTPDAHPSITRRSARVHKRDPIIAPGFGTQQDLETLANDLGQSVAVVQAIMASQGRGTRRRGQPTPEASDTTAAGGTVVNSAWANFLSEDHIMGAMATPPASTGNTIGATKPSSHRKKAGEVTGERSYSLPICPTWSQQEQPKPRSKKAKTVTAPSGGILVQAGSLDASCIGRSKPSLDRSFDLKVPSILLPRLKVNKVISSCNAAHALAIDTQGKVYGWGRNESSQLGSGLGSYVGRPFLLEGLDQIVVEGAVGKSHTIILTKHHELWAVGSNKAGQCGIKSSLDPVPNFRKCILDTKAIQISCGEAFSVALDEDGFIYTTGSSEFGQLGNGETGERILAANKITFDNCNVFDKRTSFTHVPGEKTYGGANKSDKVVELQEDIRIAHIACGKYHCLALEAPAVGYPPRVFSWGCGNYGCLGHGVQADEYKPRLIASLSAGNAWSSNPVISCAAGASCSMVLTQTGHVYYWGKHRSVGEAVMRPQLLAELANNGHVATHVAGGNQTVVICTRNAVTVAWGMGPHGELGFGEKKSSARPDFVSALDRCRVQDLACGYGTTYYVLKQDDKDDEAAIKTLPVVSDETFIELENFVETVAASKKK